METDLAPYQLWEEMGLITVTGGTETYMNDYKFIISYLEELKERFGITLLGIGIDPHNAAGVMQDLDGFGCDVVTITQSARSLNDATVAMQLLIKEGSLEYHRHDELLTWSMINASTVKRIDPSDALIDAYAVMLLSDGGLRVDVDNELESYLKMMGWN